MRRTKESSDLDLLRRVLIANSWNEERKIFGKSILLDAVIDGNLSSLNVLLHAGVNAMARHEDATYKTSFDRFARNALQTAVQYRHGDIIGALGSHVAIIFIGCPYTGFGFFSQTMLKMPCI
jgi:hypothetical protein